MEALSGLAMDDVRVHRNSSEPAKLGALAFARGADIHLGPGQEQHLPHEAWHVVQQKQGRVTKSGRTPEGDINLDPVLEAEADGFRTFWRGPAEAGPLRSPVTAPAPVAQFVLGTNCAPGNEVTGPGGKRFRITGKGTKYAVQEILANGTLASDVIRVGPDLVGWDPIPAAEDSSHFWGPQTPSSAAATPASGQPTSSGSGREMPWDRPSASNASESGKEEPEPKEYLIGTMDSSGYELVLPFKSLKPDRYLAGRVNIFGGGPDSGEKVHQTLARETMEESAGELISTGVYSQPVFDEGGYRVRQGQVRATKASEQSAMRAHLEQKKAAHLASRTRKPFHDPTKEMQGMLRCNVREFEPAIGDDPKANFEGVMDILDSLLIAKFGDQHGISENLRRNPSREYRDSHTLVALADYIALKIGEIRAEAGASGSAAGSFMAGAGSGGPAQSHQAGAAAPASGGSGAAAQAEKPET